MQYDYTKDPDAIGIANEAMLLMGGQPLQDLHDHDRNAQGIRSLLPTLIKSLLSGYPWHWCQRSVTLAPVAQFGPVTGDPAICVQPNRFNLPDDFLHLIATDQRFERQDNQLISFAGFINLIYIPALPIATFPPLIRDAIVHELAGRMAYTVTQSAAQAEQFKGMALDALKRARLSDAQQGPQLRVQYEVPAFGTDGHGDGFEWLMGGRMWYWP